MDKKQCICLRKRREVMSLKECYEKMGADYEDVLSRLRSEGLVRKFAVKFLDDDSYAALKDAMAAGRGEFDPVGKKIGPDLEEQVFISVERYFRKLQVNINIFAGPDRL